MSRQITRRIVHIFMILFAGALIVLGGGHAAAQDDGSGDTGRSPSGLDQAANESNWSEAYQGCVNRAADQYADDELFSDAAQSRDVGTHDASGRTQAMRNGQRQRDTDEAREQERKENREKPEWAEAREEFLAKGNDEIGKLVESLGCGARQPVNWVGEAVSDWWDSPFGKFIQMIKDGNPQVVMWTMTIWQDININFDGVLENANGITNLIWKYAVYGFGLSILIGAVKVASKRNDGAADGLVESSRGYMQFLGYGIVAPSLIVPLTMGFDKFADFIMERYVLGGDSIEALAENAKVGEDLNPFLVALLIIPAFFGSAAMAILLALRPVIMALLLGAMPIIAAWRIGRPGRTAMDMAFGTLLSGALLKIITILFYAAAVWTVRTVGESDQSQLLSAVIMGLAALGAGAVFKKLSSGFSGIEAGPSPGQVAGAAALATGAVAGVGGAMLGGVGGALGKAGGGMASATGAAGGGQSASGAKGAGEGPRSQSRSTGISGNGDSGPSTGSRATGSSASPSSDGGPSTGAPTGGQSAAAPTSEGGPSTGSAAPTRGQRVGATVGRGVQSSGHGMQTGAKVMQRVAQNSIGFTTQAMNVSQGLTDGTVGASTHPSR